ncbi:Uncharacterized conserved protein, DUF924 family [Pseudooceanicola antarcticus]|uniref:DUF924 domain-containing protein n=1 Tax=Pseudooceanicola antarcticus TaxID=1247613 RepID=A0A285J676_9RHOB|nr:DUF924 family protein [Pseudooceanicola antarcticus]PJE26938.1 DUF924 domain-containing protein [Pseudooceanicola antarcticus]SNY55829.1 Uncharacterized conserved protein, DUF924 family [Pseudooceanicola antarcticus]
MIAPEEVLSFWLDEVGPSGWYKGSDDLDQQIRDAFGEAWQAAVNGTYGLWLTYPSGALAYIILMDQFPRNMFRGQAKAFASDKIALAASKMSVDHGWDMKIDEPARQFFYLPMMHSENLCDQDRCVRLMAERMPVSGASNMIHAKAHREVIRKFGRFPYRNEALQRRGTASEAAYLEKGGYGATMRELEAAAS